MNVLVLGAEGMVGGAVARILESERHFVVRHSRAHCDLENQAETLAYFKNIRLYARIDAVVVAASKVGGIAAVKADPAGFIHKTLAIGINSVEGALKAGIERLIYVGSSCSYSPKAPLPIKERDIFCGPFEPISEPYDVAKTAIMKLCQFYQQQHGVDYSTLIACNLYGPWDNYDPENSHLIAALIRKISAATKANEKTVELWGDGTPKREVMHVDDFASAVATVLGHREAPYHWMNVGAGNELSVYQLASRVACVTGYEGTIKFDPSRPNGIDSKLMDSSKMRAMGWAPKVDLDHGLLLTVADYERRLADGRLRSERK